MTVGIFLRCPVSVAERIRAAIRRENTERAAAKLDPFALYKGEPCLPPYFARAGERETAAIEADGADRIEALLVSGAHAVVSAQGSREATLNVNFDVSPALAARCVAAIRAMNKALRAAKSEPICLRSGQPSLPQFFLRAGLLELDRDEARAGKLATAKAAPVAPNGKRADAVRALLRGGPASMDDLVAAGLQRYEARNTISSLMTKGDVIRRKVGGKKSLYALTESGREKPKAGQQT